MPRSMGSGFTKAGYNRKNKIPGVSGRRVPGGQRLSSPAKVGGFLTRVPFINPREGGSAAFREYHRQPVRDIHGRFAGGWGFAWVGLASTDDTLYGWAGEITEQIKSNVFAVAKMIEDDMRANAPWKDRTPEEREADGDPPNRSARAELQARVVWNRDNTFSIQLGHGPDIYYGIWLEVRWGGRYAILVPTAEKWAPILASRLMVMT